MSCRLVLRFQVKFVQFPWNCPIPSKQPEKCDRISCFINGSLFTEVLPLCGCWTFLKAKKSLGFRTCCSSLWTCAPGAGGPLHEVFCTGNVCACTGFACLLITVIGMVFLEGVVVLKREANSGFSHWLCTSCCHFHMSPNIWNTFDRPEGALILSPLILLK